MNDPRNVTFQLDRAANRHLQDDLRRIHTGLTYLATFGLGWLCGVLICVGKIKGWW